MVQRAQQDPNKVSGDEWQQLDSAIGTNATGEVLAGEQWIPEFKGISGQLWGGAAIQMKSIDDNKYSQVEQENKTGLPDNLKAGIENLSGISMDDVRVHYNSSKPSELQALAYTQGTNIHVGPGQEKYLPHEAWHVVQQKQGRVHKMVEPRKGVWLNMEPGLEKEAEVMGTQAKKRGWHNSPMSYDLAAPADKLVQEPQGGKQGMPVVQAKLSDYATYPIEWLMVKSHKFLPQPNTQPDCNLCAYYAYYHYTNGGTDKATFNQRAITHYQTRLEMNFADAQAMYQGGNDPSVLESFQLNLHTTIPTRAVRKFIVAGTMNGGGHFWTIKRIGWHWWSFDSYHQQAPSRIMDLNAYLGVQPPSTTYWY
ncbi:hypothetical protein BC008_33845 [Mastigocoleus testarum BC008]|uniref:eCIS core domain-containing protein n=1 Tax=Mastigocoleus testarum BC008 TaxID=371196 RepID=A0A0V7ZVW0_9CYAN|nr:hypothetical protein BC008_33845 [Mastigocoleus testarum BC008]